MPPKDHERATATASSSALCMSPAPGCARPASTLRVFDLSPREHVFRGAPATPASGPEVPPEAREMYSGNAGRVWMRADTWRAARTWRRRRLPGTPPVAEVRAHVADEENHRRGVLERGVHAHRGLGRARAARHEAQSRAAGELAVGLGHVRRPRLLAADHELHLVLHVVEPIKHREEALAGYGEGAVAPGPLAGRRGGARARAWGSFWLTMYPLRSSPPALLPKIQASYGEMGPSLV